MNDPWCATFFVLLVFVAVAFAVQRPWRADPNAGTSGGGIAPAGFLVWMGAIGTTTYFVWPLIPEARIPWLMPFLAYELVRLGFFVGRNRAGKWRSSPNWPYAAIGLGCLMGVLLRVYL